MKRALIGILSAGIFALSLGLESANAQMYGPTGPYGDSRAYNSRASAAQLSQRGAPRRCAQCSAL
jgi:hypothetical protein